MKKISSLIAMFAAVCAFIGCTQTPKAQLKNDVDSLSYMFGVANNQGMLPYAQQQFGLDTAYMEQFVKGIVEGMKDASSKATAYYAGVQIGQQFSGRIFNAINQEVSGSDSVKVLSKENLLAGFLAGVQGKAITTPEAAAAYVESHLDSIKNRFMRQTYAEIIAEGEKFLAENKTKEGVQVTPSGLQYKVITAGTGEVPTASDNVEVNYKGTLIDGTEFDSSYSRNEPSKFRADQVIRGWTEALTMMPVGSKWELYIPYDLAYGNRAAGEKIKPFSTLIFEVELISIVKDKK